MEDYMNWAMQMLLHPKELQEFSQACQVIQPFMADPNNNRDAKRSMLNTMVNELTENCFKLKPIAEQTMTIINMKEDVCKEHYDTQAQVNAILGWLPRFKGHRDLLTKEVEKHRKEYGLKV